MATSTVAVATPGGGGGNAGECLRRERRSLDLLCELRESAEYVGTILRGMPRNLTRKTDGEVWTSTKLLRRLAWHERGELAVIRHKMGEMSRGGQHG